MKNNSLALRMLENGAARKTVYEEKREGIHFPARFVWNNVGPVLAPLFK